MDRVWLLYFLGWSTSSCTYFCTALNNWLGFGLAIFLHRFRRSRCAMWSLAQTEVLWLSRLNNAQQTRATLILI